MEVQHYYVQPASGGQNVKKHICTPANTASGAQKHLVLACKCFYLKSPKYVEEWQCWQLLGFRAPSLNKFPGPNGEVA